MSLGWARSRSFGTFESTYLDWEHRMSIFGKLMSKIFGRGEEAAGPAPVAPTVSAAPAAPAVSSGKIPAELLD